MKFSLNRLVTHGVKTWEQRPDMAWLLAIVWVVVISSIAFFWNLGSTGLLDETEPLFAEAARQMTVTGDWITPFFNGVTRFDKPPLIYWLMAIAYHTFGVNSFAARLPSALAGLALTSFCFYTLRYFGNPTSQARGTRQEVRAEEVETNLSSLASHSSPAQRQLWQETQSEEVETNLSSLASHRSPAQRQLWLVASLGAAMVALNPLTLFFGRTGYSDMLLSACMGGALLTFFLGYAQPERRTVQERWYLACYVLMALAVLTKGPVGVVLPGLIIGSFLLYVGKAREVLGEMRLVRGALIILAISLPWFILVILRNGEAYIDSFFGYHNFERFTSVVNQHNGPIYFHLLVVLLGFAPWSMALPSAIARVPVLQRRKWLNSSRSSHLGLFALLWFLIILGFFTLAVTKYFSYTLPLMPAAAILVALWWGDQIVQVQRFDQAHGRLKLTYLLSIGLFVLLGGVCFWSPQLLGNDSSMPNLGLGISQAGLPVIGAVIWGVSAIAGIVLLLRRKPHWLWLVSFLGFVAFWIFLLMPALAIVDVERQLPLRQIAQSAVQIEAPGEQLVMLTNGFEKPTLVFYTQRHVNYFHDLPNAVPYLQATAKQSSSQSVLVVATDKSLQKAGLQPNQYQEIQNAGIYKLLRVSS
jgi:4-amino-4-deoxy-L-arabinose transferase-like glycosyltransferase